MTPHVPHNYCALPGSEHHKVKGARRVKPVDPDEAIRVLIRVRRPPGAAPACDHFHWERTKPGQRKFLARKELCEKYGASDADLERRCICSLQRAGGAGAPRRSPPCHCDRHGSAAQSCFCHRSGSLRN